MEKQELVISQGKLELERQDLAEKLRAFVKNASAHEHSTPQKETTAPYQNSTGQSKNPNRTIARKCDLSNPSPVTAPTFPKSKGRSKEKLRNRKVNLPPNWLATIISCFRNDGATVKICVHAIQLSALFLPSSYRWLRISTTKANWQGWFWQ